MSNPRDRTLHEHVHQEHEELRERFASIHRALADPAASPVSVAETLQSLDRHLQEHFDDEEGTGSFFDAVCAQAPRLSQRAEALKQEHAWLGNALRELIECVDQPKSVQWREELEAKFHEFSKSVMQHESKENELLQEAYGDDIGSAD
jgi:iron-sulfur cluster repair protein YtfE (RIC family)